MTESFEPRIIAMVCNWCTYTAADLAGTSRLSYPSNVRMVRLMCTGMIDAKYIIKAFLDGADGVFIGGCHPGDCHYINGNIKAEKRISGVGMVLEQFGFDPERLKLAWIGASEGPEFQKHMTTFVEKIKEMGPGPARFRMVL
ncbi:MAG: hydrogenase iron-sulfur subunit [Desulfobacteraceae bacterium]|nr:hydrogenase iron-sulfur subunit [Desulfobacteraceae bacterium]MBU4054261.1 hydrogenase iron-sulfur subunit [Pseudomonadota bacterium]